MNGYIRLSRSTSPRIYRLIVRIEETDPLCGPRVVGRMVLRGFLAPPSTVLGEIPNTTEAASAPTTLPQGAHLRPIARISALSGSPTQVPSLRAVPSGQTYRLVSAQNRNMVSPPLAATLEKIFEQFATSRGFTAQAPLAIAFARGYASGDRGHGSGLAADIAGVGGRSFQQWKQDWDRAVTQSSGLPTAEAKRAAVSAEAQRNLGYQLYRTLLDHGGWRVFNNVVQLFGPWTDQLGPWRRLRFENPTEDQRQLVAEQEHIFQAHQDHIHVALG